MPLRAGPARTCQARRNGRWRPEAVGLAMPSAWSGNGRAEPIHLIRATGPRLARSASTTANSWSIRWSCVARRWRRPPAIRGSPIAISFIRPRAGNLPGCGWSNINVETVMARVAQAAPRAAPSVETADTFAADVVAGLTAKPKRLPPKYFYDATGSALFERITQLPEYYPTRCELALLRDHAPAIASLFPPGCALIEFGSGSSRKARILFGAAATVEAYVPVDISGDFLQQDAAQLRRDFPHLGVYPLVEDFTKAFTLPPAIAALPRVGFFPGSTIGNFEPHEACKFLRHAGGMLGKGAPFVVGVG